METTGCTAWYSRRKGEVEQIDSCISQRHTCEMKSKHRHPRFQLGGTDSAFYDVNHYTKCNTAAPNMKVVLHANTQFILDEKK